MSAKQSTKRIAPGRRIERTCPACSKSFQALCLEINRGAGIFCGTKCYHVARKRPLVIRFWEKVNKDGPVPAHCPELGPCWLWTGAASESGYGTIHDPESKRKQGLTAAHRVSWRLAYGPVPDDLKVLHKCDAPGCIRPSHLFTGTLKDNTQDMLKKRRHIVKLTAAQVVEVRRRYAAGGVSQTTLAKEFGLGQNTVSRIVRHANTY